ncbi:MAG: sigma-70 family RNA polymerase sigma factor [Clostridia bacterium]|nr:sigma-70 family RNA polymerase sigma factor [Clostridia bacterium]
MTDYSDNISYIIRSRDGDESATEELIRRNYALAASIAKRFCGRGVDYEDLIQLALIGMLKAIRSFDIDRGTAFSTYAVPLIMGEIRKFLRDDGIIKVNRQSKRNGAILMRAREEFIEIKGREPRIEELKEITNLEFDEISIALESCRPVASLSDQIGDDPSLTIENTVEDTESSIDRVFDRIALSDALERLPDNWRKIIVLRYFKDYSQQKTADILGLSQVKVSREEKKIIAELRKNII